ncbi:sialate O-acetylesterase [Pedobacter sp. KBW01]|uniref:sialate O-acetylesterase n=1 Tax=Pedobacter sp. KBW01 TaxID=2153364 RepID=UPI000F5B6DE8|nr:sialate O-acetylesterase [Pedobacter sp. KBW01]RQO72759.1 sialate O-acetylesterase [Pedobacter sp. KBW01]
MKKNITFLFSILLFNFFVAKADIRLPNVLASNMVLQQKSTTKLWGWASPAEKIKITTSWDNKTIEVTATGNADWQASVQTPAAGGPYTISFEGQNKVVLEDILIGEVWVCGGQSNMEWSYNQTIKSIKEEFGQLSGLKIRLFQVPKGTSKSPQDDLQASWKVCDSNTLKAFSAVGYYFGKKLNQNLNVPIGLIGSNWGGTPAEVWTPEQLVNADTSLKTVAEKRAQVAWWPVSAGLAYNSMIAPLTNFNIAGVIWYQGESNRDFPSTYSKLLGKMLDAWRNKWQKDFPFYFVQIAPFKSAIDNEVALLQEQQAKFLGQNTNVGMVVVSDITGDVTNIHPTNKKDVGTRLGNLALSKTYGKIIPGAGSPLYQSVSFNGAKAQVTFNIGDSKGLQLQSANVDELFLAGQDGIFYPAKANIGKNIITVSSNQVKSPKAVRYQFSNTGIGNLKNKEGLPVAPFRTDNWEIGQTKIK